MKKTTKFLIPLMIIFLLMGSIVSAGEITLPTGRVIWKTTLWDKIKFYIFGSLMATYSPGGDVITSGPCEGTYYENAQGICKQQTDCGTTTIGSCDCDSIVEVDGSYCGGAGGVPTGGDCSDGTPEFECSTVTIGKYCYDGLLDWMCTYCGCSSGYECSSSGSTANSCVPIGATCMDNDEGDYGLIAGAVESGGTTLNDYCYNAESVVEYYCMGDTPASTYVDCAYDIGTGYSCVSGKCVYGTQCDPGKRRCSEGYIHFYDECLLTGLWDATLYCGEGKKCEGEGNCVDEDLPPECTPEDKRCTAGTANFYDECDADGFWDTIYCGDGKTCEGEGNCIGADLEQECTDLGGQICSGTTKFCIGESEQILSDGTTKCCIGTGIICVVGSVYDVQIKEGTEPEVIIVGNEIRVGGKLINKGQDIPNYLLELQAIKKGEPGPMAAFYLEEPAKTCDPDYPDNVHGIISDFKNEDEVPYNIFTEVENGEYDIYLVSVDKCYAAIPEGNNKYPPFCDPITGTCTKETSYIDTITVGVVPEGKPCGELCSPECTGLLCGGDGSGSSDECATGWCWDGPDTKNRCEPTDFDREAYDTLNLADFKKAAKVREGEICADQYATIWGGVPPVVTDECDGKCTDTQECAKVEGIWVCKKKSTDPGTDCPGCDLTTHACVDVEGIWVCTPKSTPPPAITCGNECNIDSECSTGEYCFNPGCVFCKSRCEPTDFTKESYDGLRDEDQDLINEGTCANDILGGLCGGPCDLDREFSCALSPDPSPFPIHCMDVNPGLGSTYQCQPKDMTMDLIKQLDDEIIKEITSDGICIKINPPDPTECKTPIALSQFSWWESIKALLPFTESDIQCSQTLTTKDLNDLDRRSEKMQQQTLRASMCVSDDNCVFLDESDDIIEQGCYNQNYLQKYTDFTFGKNLGFIWSFVNDIDDAGFCFARIESEEEEMKFDLCGSLESLNFFNIQCGGLWVLIGGLFVLMIFGTLFMSMMGGMKQQPRYYSLPPFKKLKPYVTALIISAIAVLIAQSKGYIAVESPWLLIVVVGILLGWIFETKKNKLPKSIRRYV